MSIIPNISGELTWPAQIDISSVGMEYSEALKAEQYIKGKGKMLEWGGGGSTLYFPTLVEKYVSVEHSLQWYENLKPQVLDNVELYHVAIHGEKFDDDIRFLNHMMEKHGFRNPNIDKPDRNSRGY